MKIDMGLDIAIWKVNRKYMNTKELNRYVQLSDNTFKVGYKNHSMTTMVRGIFNDN